MEYIKLSYHHLNFEDRTALMLESRKEGFSARKFAELIKRHPSTIYRELKRNSINDVYQARYASDNTFARRRRGHRKLKIDSILWKFIVEAIRCLWSPQQIAKRLKTFPDLDQTIRPASPLPIESNQWHCSLVQEKQKRLLYCKREHSDQMDWITQKP